MERFDLRGKFHTIEELEATRLRLARKANRRLRALEKAGYDYYAYDVATLYTERTRDSKRFSENKKLKMSKEALVHEIDALLTFLNSKSSTVKGQKTIEDNKISAFRKKGYDVDSPRELFNFFDSAVYNDLANRKGITSDELVDFYLRNKESGTTEDAIYEALEKFRSQEIVGVDELFSETGLSILDERVTNKN